MERFFRGLDTPNMQMTLLLITVGVVLVRYFLRRYKKPMWPATIALVLIAGTVFMTQVHYRFTNFLEHGSYGTYHYFMGSKYFNELGYYGLYRYSVLADEETGIGRLEGLRRIRNLEDYKYQRANRALRQAKKERERDFTDARWEEFKKDWRPMAKNSVLRHWDKKLNDHGFNPAPFWNVIPGMVAQNIEVGDKEAYTYWRTLDFFAQLIVLILVAVLVGVDSACLVFIFANTSWYYHSHFFPTFFQFMWYHALVLGMVFWRRGWMKASGVAFAFTTMLRVFPLMFVAGPFLIWARDWYQTRKLPKKLTAFVVSFTVAATAFGLIGFTQGKGLKTSFDFLDNITMHAESIKFAANKFGLKRMLCTDFGRFTTRIKTFEREKEFADRPVTYRLLWLLMLGLGLAAILWRTEKDHWVVPLGNVFIFALMVASRYYYLMLVVFLIPGREKRGSWWDTLATASILFIHAMFFPLERLVNEWTAFTWGSVSMFAMFIVLPASLLVHKYLEVKRAAKAAQPLSDSPPPPAATDETSA